MGTSLFLKGGGEQNGLYENLVHHVGRWALLLQFLFHEVHVGRGVLEKLVVAFAEVVETVVAVFVRHKPVFRTFAVAGKLELTFAALLGQAAVLEAGKLVLLLGIHHFGDGLVVEVAQSVLGIDEVVARVDIAIELHHPRVAALFGQRAESRCLSHPVGEGGVEDLDEVFAHIVPHPLIENGAEEVTPLLGRDGEVGQSCGIALHAGGEGEAVGALHGALHNGGELDVVAIDAFEEVVELEGVVGVEVVDHRQRVPFHAVLVEQVDAPHHLAEGGTVARRPAIFVVELLRPIDGDAHEEVVFLEEAAPLVGEQRGIGLNTVVDGAAAGVGALEFQGTPIEGDRTHERFATMPGEEYFGGGLSFDVFLDELLQQFVRQHLLPGVVVEFVLF